jgi:threonine dehydrogenase-like Zn-dependent dehydrogenase
MTGGGAGNKLRMKAVVFHGAGDIRIDDVDEPRIVHDQDAVIDVTSSAICGTDLHFVRGSMKGVEEGKILGHEAVGIVREIGKGVRNLSEGDRVVVGSTIACGYCSYCRSSYYSKCDNANPYGSETAFYGGPKQSGPFEGLQAERARIPFANVGAVKLPDEVSDDDAILLSDIMPTAYFAADMASIKPGHSVAVLGCGPVGQMAIASAKLFDAGRIFAVDAEPSRLATARKQGAEVIDFSRDDPAQVIKELTGGIGVDCVIECVGVDAYKEAHPPKQWAKGDAPQMPLAGAIEMVAKAGHISIVGLYPEGFKEFDLGKAFGKNVTIRMGDCPHRRYLPKLVRMVATGMLRPSRILSKRLPFGDAVDAYKAFDKHEEGWLKVELLPSKVAKPAEKGELVTA